MAGLSIPNPDAQVRQALALDDFAPKPTPFVDLAIDAEALAKAVAPLTVAELDASPGQLLIVLHKDGVFAAVVDVGRVDPPQSMADAVVQQFALISGPVDQVRAVPTAGLDLMALLSDSDSYAVGVRGSFIATAKTVTGVPASPLATTTLSLIR